MPSNNPFSKATPVAKKLKILLWGESGCGKTSALLTFPGLAVIDTERGTDLYIDDSTNMLIVRTMDLTAIEDAIAFVAQDKGKTIQTLALDSITPVYQVLIESEMKRIEKNGKNESPYTKANARIRRIYNALVNLPVHVVVTAREADRYRSQGNFFTSDGNKADSSKDIDYSFDFVIAMNADHSGEVKKQRGKRKWLENRLAKVEWSCFVPAAEAYAKGEDIETEGNEEVAERDFQRQTTARRAAPVPIDPNDMTNQIIARQFVEQCQMEGISQPDLKSILNVQYFTQWTQGVAKAQEMVNQWWLERNANASKED